MQGMQAVPYLGGRCERRHGMHVETPRIDLLRPHRVKPGIPLGVMHGLLGTDMVHKQHFFP